MGYVAYFEKVAGVTAAMEVRFRRPVSVGQSLSITAWVSSKARRFAETEATLTLKDGTIVTTAKAKQYISSEAIIPSDRGGKATGDAPPE